MTWSTRRSLKGLIGTLAATIALSMSFSPAYANDAQGSGSGVPLSTEVPASNPVTDPVVDPVTDPVTDPVVDPATEPVLGSETPMTMSAPEVVVLTPKLFISRSASAFKAIRSAAPFTSKNAFKTKKYAKWYANNVGKAKYKWSPTQFKCLTTLWEKESHWNFKSRSTGHKFLGIPQMYRGNLTKMKINVDFYMANPEIQIQIGVKYIKGKYGTPCKALKHFKSHRWY
jgi:hypothetical protein